MPVSTHETRFLLTAKDKTKGVVKGFKKDFSDMGKTVGGLHTKLLALAGIGGMGALIGGIVNTNREMQTLKSSLTTVTGSAEASASAFEKIQKFAVTTPFDLNNWTEAFIKMKALGLDPSEAALTSYGNTAAAMGKDLNQMIEAVADAATGEFERLKEFGIKAKSQGEEVTFTFQGVATTVGKNAKEIEQYLQSIGREKFGTAMADQMNNLGPAFSNMNQAFSTLAVKIGEAGLNDLVIGLTRNITDFTNSFSEERLHTIKSFFKGINDGFASIAEVINAITWLQGNDMLEQWQKNNPDQFAGAGSVPGGYQLGDFNRSNGNADYLNKLRELEGQKDDKTSKALEENNRWQAQILDAIKNQKPYAVAG